MRIPFAIVLLASGIFSLTEAAAPVSETGRAAIAVHQHLNAEHTIFILPSRPFYRPEEIHVRVGESVRWVNSLLAETHSVREVGTGLFAIDIPPGASASYRFQRSGEYEYRCRFHAWMSGRIIVEPRRLAVETWSLDPRFTAGRLIASREGVVLLVGGGDLPPVARLGDGGAVLVGSLAKAVSSEMGPAATGGSLWFLGQRRGELVRFDLASAHTTSFILPRGGQLKLTALAAARGGTLWLHDAAAGRLGAWKPEMGGVEWAREVRLATPLAALAAGDDGVLWFLDVEGRAGSYDPAAKQLRTQTLAAGTKPSHLIVTADGSWIVDSGRGKVLHLDRNLRPVELSLPTAGSRPAALAANLAGGVWLGAAGGQVGRVCGGEIEEYQLVPNIGYLVDIAMDREQALWLVDPLQRRLARVGPSVIREAQGGQG